MLSQGRIQQRKSIVFDAAIQRFEGAVLSESWAMPQYAQPFDVAVQILDAASTNPAFLP